MTDHMKAAIEAGAREAKERWSMTACTGDDYVVWSGVSKAVIAAAEPHLRKKWAEELVERIGASNLGAPLRIYPDATARIASGPEMRALLCEFILEGAGE